MKAYGSIRYEQHRCPYGCCATKWCKEVGNKNSRIVMDRTRRKTARQTGKHEIALSYGDIDDLS